MINWNPPSDRFFGSEDLKGRLEPSVRQVFWITSERSVRTLRQTAFYTGIYDGIGEEEEEERAVRRTLPAPVPALPSLSHPLPPNVPLALPPTAREAEAAAGMESTAAAHEAWVANLVPPPEAPLTPAEIEREAMIARRHQFMESMRNGTLTGDGVAAAREAEIFIS